MFIGAAIGIRRGTHIGVDLRYVGQSFELTIPWPDGRPTRSLLAGLERAFFRTHRRVYGFGAEGEPIELVGVRLTAIGTIPWPRLSAVPPAGRDAGGALKGRRAVVFGAGAAAQRRCPVYDRYGLRAGNQIRGPAIVEQVDSTSVIEPGFTATVDRFGNLLLRQAGAR